MQEETLRPDDYPDDEDEVRVLDEPGMKTGGSPIKEINLKWYEMLEGIDGEEGIKNCGGEDAYLPVLEIFYESIDEKSEEMETFYKAGDFENYGIRVHGLKSSARIIGAADLGDEAQRLETAAKEDDEEYIRTNHDDFMKHYKKLKDVLKDVCVGTSDDQDDTGSEKPMADPVIIEGVYEAVAEAVEDMDIEAIEEALAEIEGYALPDIAEKTIKKIKDLSEVFDYEGIKATIKEAGGSE
jgi:HPt (histidine-containing phosphotransfer) domain-containing protein